MKRILTAVMAAALMLGLGACGSIGSFGASGSGGAVMYGDPPSDISVRPIGVVVKGSHAGQTLMIAAAAATGGGLGALTAKALRAVGNDPLAVSGDPCQHEPPDSRKKIAAWQRTSMHPRVFLDCATWRAIYHYRPYRKLSISTVLRCVARTIGLAQSVIPGIGQAAKYVWKFPHTSGIESISGKTAGTSTILTDENGRITSVYVDGRWTGCAGLIE